MTAATDALGAVLAVIGGALALRSALLLAGLLILAAGVTLATRSAAGAAATLLAAALGHAWIVRVEEPRLLVRFGAAYAAYLRCVPRWIPRRRASAQVG